jgi:hypothetical protein
MNVGSTASVVARENGLELCNAIGVGLLDTAEEGCVKVRGVVRVAVTARLNTGVDAGAVAMPDLDIHVRDGLASVDVDNLVVECDIDTRLRVGDVLSDELAADIYINWSITYFFGKLAHGFLQYGPWVTSGVSRHDELPLKSLEGSVSAV